MEHRDLLKTLFGATLSTGADSISNRHPIPTMDSHSEAAINVDATNLEDDIMEENESFNEYFNGYIYSNESNPSFAQGANATPSQSDVGTSSSSKKVSHRKRKSVDIPVMSKIDEMIEWVKNASVAEQQAKISSYEDARLDLEELEVLGLISEETLILSMKALSDNDGYRHMFSKLTTHERKVAFLKTITKNM